MIVQWMASAVACAALVGAAAVCVERAIAGRAAIRRVVWLLAILCSTVTPFVARHTLVRNTAPTVGASASAGSTSSASPAPQSRPIELAVIGVWALASTAFALVLLVTYLRTLRVLHHAALQSIAGRDVHVTDDFGPAVVGVFAPRVAIPSWVGRLPVDEQTLIIAHEFEHTRAHDPLLAFVGLLAVVAMPWNVALWWQFARLRLSIEVDCDARVVRSVAGGSATYAQMLLDASEFARAMRNLVRHPALALAHSRSSLANRLDALLAPAAPRVARRSTALVVGFALLASVAFVPGPRGRAAFAGLVRSHRTAFSIGVAMSTPSSPVAQRSSSTIQEVANPGASKSVVESLTRRTPIAAAETPRARAAASVTRDVVPPPRIIDTKATTGLVVQAASLPRHAVSAGIIRARSDGGTLTPMSRERVMAPTAADTALGAVFVRRRFPQDSASGSARGDAVIRVRRDSTPLPNL